MVVPRDVPHEDADLTVVDLAPVATPLALDSHRVHAAFGKTAGIEGDDALEVTQLLGHLSHQHRDQRAMIPGRRPDEVLDDLALDIDQGRDRLSILALQVGQEPNQIAIYMVLAGLSLKSLLIGHDELAQTVHYR